MDSAAAKTTRPAEPIRVPSTFGFGGGNRLRRKPLQVVGGKSDQELIADYLATRTVTVCPRRFAEGAVRTSGDYEF